MQANLLERLACLDLKFMLCLTLKVEVDLCFKLLCFAFHSRVISVKAQVNYVT